jgi:hypothetical protein
MNKTAGPADLEIEVLLDIPMVKPVMRWQRQCEPGRRCDQVQWKAALRRCTGAG